MVVTTTSSTSGFKVHSGTKQEVLDALAGVKVGHVISFTADGASYMALVWDPPQGAIAT